MLQDELVDNSTEVTTPMTMQGHVEEDWTLDQPKQTYGAAVCQLARVLHSTGSQDSQHVKSENLAWKKSNDTVFRALEDSTGGGIGCGGTPDADEDNIKSAKFRAVQKVQVGPPLYLDAPTRRRW